MCKRICWSFTTYKDKTKNQNNLYLKNPKQILITDGATITNLSVLFLKEFLTKTKYQLTPGFSNRTFTENLNQNVFIKQSKDFYLSKGTDRSFEILFKALYNEDVRIVRPRDFLLTPSNADYRIVNDIVVEPVEGDPANLQTSNLRQDAYKDLLRKHMLLLPQLKR